MLKQCMGLHSLLIKKKVRGRRHRKHLSLTPISDVLTKSAFQGDMKFSDLGDYLNILVFVPFSENRRIQVENQRWPSN